MNFYSEAIKSNTVLHFYIKTMNLSENAVRIGFLNKISKRDSPRKGNMKQRSDLTKDVIKLSKHDKCYWVPNHFKNHASATAYF